MAESISRPFGPAQGKKEGVRCEHPDPNRPGGVCGKLLMELRNGQLGIAHRTEDGGDHFTPLTVLLSEAERQKSGSQTTTQKGEHTMRRDPTVGERKFLAAILTEARRIARKGGLFLKARDDFTCEFKIEGVQVIIEDTAKDSPGGQWWKITAREKGRFFEYQFDSRLYIYDSLIFWHHDSKIRRAVRYLYLHRRSI